MKLVVISNEKLFNKFFLNVPVSNKYLNILIHFIFSCVVSVLHLNERRKCHAYGHFKCVLFCLIYNFNILCK